MNQEIRIIGGRYRGKKISFPLIAGLRPTPDRVRETLFNWLMHDIREAECLDAFAGSGALGIEAFSRGAKSVTFIEMSQPAYQCLSQEIKTFQSEQLKILHQDIRIFIQNTHQASFDLVFYDPPFANLTFYNKTIIEDIARILKNGGLLYLESPHEITLETTTWEQLKLKKAGQVTYSLYRKREN